MSLLLLRMTLFIEHKRLIVNCMYNCARICYVNDKSRRVPIRDRDIVVCLRLLLFFYLSIRWISWTSDLTPPNFISDFSIVISILFYLTLQHRDIGDNDLPMLSLSRATLFVTTNDALSSKPICDFCFWFDIVERNALRCSSYVAFWCVGN